VTLSKSLCHTGRRAVRYIMQRMYPNSERTFSVCTQTVSVPSAYVPKQWAYLQRMYPNSERTFSVCTQTLSVHSAYVPKQWAYMQRMYPNVMKRCMKTPRSQEGPSWLWMSARVPRHSNVLKR